MIRMKVAIGGCLMAAILLPASVGAQSPDAGVTYKTVAVPAYKAIQDLSKLSKKKIRIEPPLDSQPLILAVTNIPLNTVLDKICSVLHGIWRTDDQGIDILRASDMRRQMESDRDARDAATLAKGIKELASESLAHPITPELVDQMLAALKKLNLSDPKNFDPKSLDSINGSLQQAFQTPPEEVLAARVAQLLDPTALARDLRAGTVTYSTAPKAFEQPLDIDPDALNAIVSEQNLYTKFLQQLVTLAPKQDLGEAEDFEHIKDRRIIDPNDLRVIVQVNGDPSSANLLVEMVDGKGADYIQSASFPITGEDDDNTPTPNDIQSKGLALKPLALSPLCKDFVTRMISIRKSSSAGPASQELTKALLDPENYDPLSFEVSEILIGIADQNHLNLVASPPDELAPLSLLSSPQAPPSKAILLDLDSSLAVAEGWLLYSPSNPLQAETERIDRKSLATFLQKVAQTKYATIDDMAEFMAANEGDEAPMTSVVWRNLLYPGSRGPFQQSQVGLRLWGSLDANQQQRLLDGQSLRLAELSDSAAKATVQAVTESETQMDPVDAVLSEAFVPKPGQQNTILADLPSELASTDATISMDHHPDWALQIHRRQSARNSTFGLSSAAVLLARSPSRAGWTFAAGTAETYDLRINLPSGTVLLSMSEYHNDLSAAGPYDSLPEGLRKELEADVARSKAVEATEQAQDQDESSAPDDASGAPPPSR